MQYNIAMIGLGVMGRNLALNMERNGFSVVAFDLDQAKRRIAGTLFSNKQMRVASSLKEVLDVLESPKKFFLMVPAGKAVDQVIASLLPNLQTGDIIIDGGNSHFLDSERRYRDLKEQGILFVGSGVSGGEEGALHGPALMPGGAPPAWPFINDLFRRIAAKAEDGTPCAAWLGEGGAGHFVKMVHNGIEYGDMQMIGETYFLMKHLLGLSSDEMSAVFKQWNEGPLNSYLIQITADILAQKDKETGKPMVDVILDTAGQKGTGKWTSQIALDLGVPAPTIAEAVFARFLSALKDERIAAAKKLSAAKASFKFKNKTAFIDQLEQALYASKICSYAQGFQLLQTADRTYHWNLSLSNIASIWRAGCIIRARFLNRIKQAFEEQPTLANLLLDDYFKTVVLDAQNSWRAVVVTAVQAGLPIPALSSALSYFDGYRSEQLPANLLQAQRDYFGAHTYERTDKPRGQFFHTQWT